MSFIDRPQPIAGRFPAITEFNLPQTVSQIPFIDDWSFDAKLLDNYSSELLNSYWATA